MGQKWVRSVWRALYGGYLYVLGIDFVFLESFGFVGGVPSSSATPTPTT